MSIPPQERDQFLAKLNEAREAVNNASEPLTRKPIAKPPKLENNLTEAERQRNIDQATLKHNF